MTLPRLTVILPTRNRPGNLPGLMRLFGRMPYPLVVADSSDPEHAAPIRAMVPGTRCYRAIAPELNLYDKLELVLRAVETPFVLVVSDRKITFPHAIDPLLEHLIAHEDHMIADDNPLQRHYHLMQRYQSWAFALFRVGPLLKAVTQARRVEGAVFQETLMMNALALQGKLARLPIVLSLQSEERSFHPPKRNDPLYWFVDDIGSFFRHYLRYRSALTDFIRELGIPPPPNSDLDRLVDMVHAVWLHRNFDDGVLNHAVRLLLGDAISPLSGPDVRVDWRRRSYRDIVRQGARRYIWRNEVLRAEPKSEIQISRDETDRVNAQLDIYFGK